MNNKGTDKTVDGQAVPSEQRICTDMSEPWLLAYTKYGCRQRLRLKFRPLASLDISVWAFIRVITKSRPKVMIFFMLNSTEHDIHYAHKC